MTIEELLNGNVQSSGLKVDLEHWLYSGSKEWHETSDEVKGRAYLAAVSLGWTDDALIGLLKKRYPFYDEAMTVNALGLLKDLAQKHREQ